MNKLFKIEKTVITRVPDYEVTIDLPTEPTFYQSFNFRRLTALIPQLNLETNVPYQYVVYKIEEDVLTKITLYVNEIEPLLRDRQTPNKLKDLKLHYQAIDILFSKEYESTLSKEKFFEHFNKAKDRMLKELGGIDG